MGAVFAQNTDRNIEIMLIGVSSENRSCRPPRVVLQHPAQALTTFDRASIASYRLQSCEQPIVHPLMKPLGVVEIKVVLFHLSADR